MAEDRIARIKSRLAGVKHMAKVKALGEFFEQCREDIAFLLSRDDAMRSALERILINCRDADCGDHCSNSCMFCQAREALSMTNTESQQS